VGVGKGVNVYVVCGSVVDRTEVVDAAAVVDSVVSFPEETLVLDAVIVVAGGTADDEITVLVNSRGQTM
jgi:hypothetical protein